MKILAFVVALLVAQIAHADTIVLDAGRTLGGVILSENEAGFFFCHDWDGKGVGPPLHWIDRRDVRSVTRDSDPQAAPPAPTPATPTASCGECRGKRTVKCSDCKGAGAIKCPSCLGRVAKCAACGARGSKTVTCPGCGGAKMRRCATCNPAPAPPRPPPPKNLPRSLPVILLEVDALAADPSLTTAQRQTKIREYLGGRVVTDLVVDDVRTENDHPVLVGRHGTFELRCVFATSERDKLLQAGRASVWHVLGEVVSIGPGKVALESCTIVPRFELK